MALPRTSEIEIERHDSDGSSLYTTSTSSSEAAATRRVSLCRTKTMDFDPQNPIVLERQRTAQSIFSQTVGADPNPRKRSIVQVEDLPEFGGGKPYPPLLPDADRFVVDFTGPDDPLHGQNWPLKKKVITAAVLGYTTFVSSWGSSVYSPAAPVIMKVFGVGLEVSLLGMSFYVLGFAFGPLLWAPLSELKGRRLPLIISIFGFSIFQLAVAVAKDIQTVLICRFWGGIMAACPIAVVGAVFADIFKQETRGIAIAIFSMSVFTGPLFGPIVGSYITWSHLGWRWTEYITAIMGFVAFILCLFFLKETYPPILLIDKARNLRRLTKNWGIHAKQEEIEVDFAQLIKRNFSRPMKLLVTEPIILLLSIYTAFVYGILYLFLTAYPTVFQMKRGWSPQTASLPYFGMVIGTLLGGGIVIAFQPWTNRRSEARGFLRPEDRLIPSIIGSILFPISLFWFSWAGNSTTVHWIAPAAAGVPLGMSLILIFLQCLNYLIDSYLMFAASAIAANTFVRSVFAAAFPLFGKHLFAEEPLGVGWGGSILGFVAVAMAPIPLLFVLYGERIRKRSKWAPTDE